MIPLKTEREIRKYTLYDDEDPCEDPCDLTMSSLSSVSTMSSSSFKSTASEELMMRAFAQLKSAASLSPEAHAELDQLVNRLIPNSPDTITANLAEVSSDQLEKILGLGQLTTSKLKASNGSESVSLSSRFSRDVSHATGYTDGTGTTRHHSNGLNEILNRIEGRNSSRNVPRSISMSCSSSGHSSSRSRNEGAIVPSQPLGLTRFRISAPTIEKEGSQKPKGKFSALGFMQSFFNCCSSHEVVDEQLENDS